MDSQEPQNETPDEPKYTVPTRDQVRDRREQERVGFWMPLARTGGWAHIRLLSVLDKTTLAGLSTDMQNRVLQVFADATKGNPRATTVAQFTKNRDQMEKLANVVCVASFIAPKLVMTEAELDDDPHTLLVTDLHIDERLAVYNIVMGTEAGKTEEAKLKPFRRPEPTGLVDTLPTAEARDSTVRILGDEGGRLQQPDAASA